MRTLFVVSNMGQKLIKLENSEGITTAGALREAINAYNRENKSSTVDFNQVEMVIGGSNITLSLNDAVIPEGDQRIFLMQKESKAGGSSRGEAYSIISGFIARDGDQARDHFNEDINYTNKRTSLLWELISNYGPVTGVATSVADAFNLQQYVDELEDLVLAYGNPSEIDAFNNLKVAIGLGDPAAIALAKELKEEYCKIASQATQFVPCRD